MNYLASMRVPRYLGKDVRPPNFKRPDSSGLLSFLNLLLAVARFVKVCIHG